MIKYAKFILTYYLHIGLEFPKKHFLGFCPGELPVRAFAGLWRRKWQLPLQYSCLENPVDRRGQWAAVHRVAQSRTQLKRLSMHALEKEMATHSSIIA